MHNLTPREKEITVLVATGASNKQIARQLFISVNTVKTILAKVFEKTSTQTRTELAIRWLSSQNLVNMPLAVG
ncbi:MAG: response regulator transcription factor [Chloroflexi bacterium]|nr:response regulator transcription factor [Chloroflexota bacterium]